MKLADGTTAEVVAVVNDGGAINAVVEVTWPDGSVARGFINFAASLAVTSGPMEAKIKGLGGLSAAAVAP